MNENETSETTSARAARTPPRPSALTARLLCSSSSITAVHCAVSCIRHTMQVGATARTEATQSCDRVAVVPS